MRVSRLIKQDSELKTLFLLSQNTTLLLTMSNICNNYLKLNIAFIVL